MIHRNVPVIWDVSLLRRRVIDHGLTTLITLIASLSDPVLKLHDFLGTLARAWELIWLFVRPTGPKVCVFIGQWHIIACLLVECEALDRMWLPFVIVTSILHSNIYGNLIDVSAIEQLWLLLSMVLLLLLNCRFRMFLTDILIVSIFVLKRSTYTLRHRVYLHIVLQTRSKITRATLTSLYLNLLHLLPFGGCMLRFDLGRHFGWNRMGSGNIRRVASNIRVVMKVNGLVRDNAINS